MNLIVRRLGFSEGEKWKDTQPSSTLLRRARNHRIWMKNVLKELRTGERIAFGAFVVRSDSSPDLLVGSILLERGEPGVVIATNLVVEFKELISDNVEKASRIRHVQSRLVKRVESFCRQRGFWQMDVEVFAHETGELPYQPDLVMNVLLEANFELQSLRPSTYYPQDKYYTFSKKLPFSFFGDWAKQSELSRWLLEDHFQFASISGPETLYFHEKGFCHGYIFDVPYWLPGFRIRGVSLVDVDVDGDYCEVSELVAILTGKPNRLIKDDGLANDSDLSRAIANANVRVLITFRKLNDRVNHPHIWIFDADRLKEILDPEIISQPTGRDVGGIVIELAEDKLDERIRNQKAFGYYVASGLGDEIYFEFKDPAGEQPREFYALIAAHQHQGPMVWGVARLDKIEPYTPSAAYSGLPPEMRLWDQAQFDFYVNEFTSSYKQHDTTYVLSLGHPVRLKRPFPYHELFTPSGDEQKSLDLEVTTRYVKKGKIDSLMEDFHGEFSDATSQEGVVSATSFRADQLASRLATYLDVAKVHFPGWFSRQIEANIDSLRKALIQAHRDSGASPAEEEVQIRNSLQMRDPQKVLFPETERVDLGTLSKLAIQAWQIFRAKNGEESNSMRAWRVRLLSGELIKAARSQLNLKKKDLEQLREVFPTVAALRDGVKNAFEPPLKALFPEDSEPNSRRAGRRMIVDKVLKFESVRIDSSLGIESNEIFVDVLLRAIFNEPGSGHLIAIAEAITKKAIDADEEDKRHDITQALMAMKAVEDSLPSGILS